jgi:hypothetical protein
MRRLAAPVVVLAAVLALAGCSDGGSSEPTPTPTLTVGPAETLDDAATLDEVVDYVLAQDQGSMSSDEVADAASKLNGMAADLYSDAKYGELKADFNVLTINAVQHPDEEWQPQLIELTKQVRELD